MKKLYFFITLIIAAVTLKAQPQGYYDGTEGLTGTALKAKLHTIIKDDDHVSYSGLWSAYQQTDKKPNGKVWDIYSDVPNGTPPYQFTFGSDQCGNYSGEGDCYNREHLWAQSWTNDNATHKTDLHHVYPTDGYVNNRRGNYAFGEVNKATWTSQNGGKLGPDRGLASGHGRGARDGIEITEVDTRAIRRGGRCFTVSREHHLLVCRVRRLLVNFV